MPPTAAPGATAGRLDPEILRLPFYEPHHLGLARRISRWCEELKPAPDGEDPRETGRRLLRALGDAGLLAHLDPDAAEEVRRDGDFRGLCLVREALARTDDLADFAFSVQVLAALPILRYGTAEQRRRHLPGMAAGRTSGSFAVSEEQAGSDLAALALRAERVEGGYLLDGAKTWVACGSTADLHCVLARTGEGPGLLGLTAFLVPADLPGLHTEQVALTAPRSLATLSFDRCPVPESSVLGRPGGGAVIALDTLARARMTVGAAALGFARCARDAALTRARSRPMQGGRLFDLDTVKAGFADTEVKLNAAALLVARAAWEADRAAPGFARHSSIAKLYATEAAQQVVDACVQVFGAAGLVSGSLPESLYRQIRSLRIYEGASEVQRAIIAEVLAPAGPAHPREGR
ncbi:acyl-CoA dehydrogenase family protein [Peterkaempfera griseoplana]|uniref:acyl-CoA dehydrogenase family protein n=1 Tax=Peterkaempfera griseoplana TaxID=66896 RepID=UPI0006E379FD|nr:acyl-CoA dehydrogenase [Peterkaempfera griseoplana]